MRLQPLLPYTRVLAYAALGYLLIRINLNTGRPGMAVAMAVFTAVAIVCTLLRR
ncbi:MAG: hypothetical protein GWO81_06685 [Verrucomicrobia bacterium]|nr:hypothetical protein [Verrucomicrobiota bacterium]